MQAPPFGWAVLLCEELLELCRSLQGGGVLEARPHYGESLVDTVVGVTDLEELVPDTFHPASSYIVAAPNDCSLVFVLARGVVCLWGVVCQGYGAVSVAATALWFL